MKQGSTYSQMRDDLQNANYIRSSTRKKDQRILQEAISVGGIHMHNPHPIILADGNTVVYQLDGYPRTGTLSKSVIISF